MCKAMPRTCALLRATPLTYVKDGQAKLSQMRKGTIVRPHAGPTNARLRMHCALWVFKEGPEAATLRVGEHDTVHWSSGKCFVFDESYEHAVSTVGSSSSDDNTDDNNTRMVLIVDLVNPFLTSMEALREFGVSDEGWAVHRGALERAWTEAGAEGPGKGEL